MPSIIEKVIKYFKITHKEQEPAKPKRVFKLPNTLSYRNVLLRNVNPISIPHARNNKSRENVNKIVEDNMSRRPYNDWWKIDYSVKNEYNIIEN